MRFSLESRFSSNETLSRLTLRYKTNKSGVGLLRVGSTKITPLVITIMSAVETNNAGFLERTPVPAIAASQKLLNNFTVNVAMEITRLTRKL